MRQSNQFSLLRQRRFAPFFATQFLGAFNDNIFRNGLIIVITFQGGRLFGLDASQLANLAGALFILPFFILSATAGQLADRFEKSGLMRRIKLLEIGLMLIAAYAFTSERLDQLFLLLFLMGCQSALFGPVKYAYLPQQLATSELIGGNALVESGTYTAIILGLIVGGLAVSEVTPNQQLLAASLVSVAIAGYSASCFVPRTRAADPDLKIRWNLWRETWRIVGFARRDRAVFLCILGISWFWFFGTAMTLQMPAYTLDVLNGDKDVTTILLVAFAVGVGTGSLLCEKLSGKRIELGLVPFGSAGLTLFAVDLYFAEPGTIMAASASAGEFLQRDGAWRVLFDLAALGAFGGFYSVPLYAFVQENADPRQMSRIIAANNIINALFMVVAAILALLLFYAGLSIPQFFLVLALLNVLVAAYIYALLPRFLMRFIAWLLISTLYRIRVTGLERIPDTGPAVLVCNHVSYVDALVLGGSIHRPVRFVMWYRIFDIPLLRLLFRTAGAIPIASAREDERILAEAYESIDRELAAGHLVCIFPEGAITSDGDILPFRPGIENIVARRPVPVIPIALCGLWGSWFSRRKGGGLRRLPGKLRARVEVRVGQAVPAKDASAGAVELLVRTLRGRNR